MRGLEYRWELHRLVVDAPWIAARLTDTGRHAFAGAQPVHLTHLRTLLFDALSTEQLDTFGELAEIILAHIDALDRDRD